MPTHVGTKPSRFTRNSPKRAKNAPNFSANFIAMSASAHSYFYHSSPSRVFCSITPACSARPLNAPSHLRLTPAIPNTSIAARARHFIPLKTAAKPGLKSPCSSRQNAPLISPTRPTIQTTFTSSSKTWASFAQPTAASYGNKSASDLCLLPKASASSALA